MTQSDRMSSASHASRSLELFESEIGKFELTRTHNGPAVQLALVLACSRQQSNCSPTAERTTLFV
jgi:hypothetical protein